MKKIFILTCLLTVSIATSVYCQGNTSLFEIAQTDTVDQMKALLESGADIDQVDGYGYSPVMRAAAADNYPVFEFLVQSYARLDLVTNKGCPLQILIGCMSLENFDKACALLSGRNFDLDKPTKENFSLLHFLVFKVDLAKVECLLRYKPALDRKGKIGMSIPIDMLQYATYPFTDTAGSNADAIKNAPAMRKLLMDAGSDDITYAPLIIGNFGNFLVAHFMVISTLNPSTNLRDINRSKYYTFYNDGNREVAPITIESLYSMYKDLGIEIKITTYESNFPEVIKSCEDSPASFFLLANLGNHPLISQAWVAFSGINADGSLRIANPDARSEIFDYRSQDIAELMTIEILQKPNP